MLPGIALITASSDALSGSSSAGGQTPIGQALPSKRSL
jgi:hypothetical protein